MLINFILLGKKNLWEREVTPNIKMTYFIVFEGTEGCGKSTQIHYLAKKLFSHNKFMQVLLTRESYKNRDIRSILEQDSNPYSQAEKLANLFIQDRKEHLNEVILPGLEKNIVVISDRYKYSTIAYQGSQGLDLNYLIKKHEGLLVPDIIFILDVPVKVSRKRLKKRKDKRKENKFEDSDEFLEKLKRRYLEMPSIFKEENIVVINGNRRPKKIANEIWGYVENIIKE